MEDQCYGLDRKTHKQCPNEAVWIEHGDYDDPLISGVYHCQLCDECYQYFKKFGGEWRHADASYEASVGSEGKIQAILTPWMR
jgi:hypothetical protein